MAIKLHTHDLHDTPPSSLMDSLQVQRWRQWKEKELGRALWLTTLRGRGARWSSGMGLGRLTAIQSLTQAYTNQTTSWLVRSWSTLVHRRTTRANINSQDSSRPGPKGSHHLPPYSGLCAWPRDQHPNVILSRDSQVWVPKFPKLGFLQLWGPITLCANLRLRWGLKKSCTPCQELSNDMSHATCMQGNQGNS
jgi:hypothetical protein